MGMLFGRDDDDWDVPKEEIDFESSVGGFGSSFRKGSWYLNSKQNPSWNCSGRTSACGGFAMPLECEQKIEQLKKIFGNPPDDLE